MRVKLKKSKKIIEEGFLIVANRRDSSRGIKRYEEEVEKASKFLNEIGAAPPRRNTLGC
jgi:hypothetical protein